MLEAGRFVVVGLALAACQAGSSGDAEADAGSETAATTPGGTDASGATDGSGSTSGTASGTAASSGSTSSSSGSDGSSGGGTNGTVGTGGGMGDGTCVGARASGGMGGPSPGIHDNLAYSAGTYSLFVPPDYAGEPTTVWILAHGLGDPAASFLAYNVSYVFGETSSFILAAPEPEEEGPMIELLDHVESQFNVDCTRVYALGHSRGGAFLNRMLTNPSQANRFAAHVITAMGQNFGPPAATPDSPAVALTGDPGDVNWSGPDGAAYALELESKGYDVKVIEHSQGHTIPFPEIYELRDWALAHTK